MEALSRPAASSKESNSNIKGLACNRGKAFPQRELRAGRKFTLSQQRKAIFSKKSEKANNDKAKHTEALKLRRPMRKCVKHTVTKGLKSSIQANMSKETIDGIFYETTNEVEASDFETITDISASGSDDDYTPPAIKVTGKNTNCLKNKVRLKCPPKVNNGVKQQDAKSFESTDKICSINSELSRRSKSALQQLAVEVKI